SWSPAAERRPRPSARRNAALTAAATLAAAVAVAIASSHRTSFHRSTSMESLADILIVVDEGPRRPAAALLRPRGAAAAAARRGAPCEAFPGTGRPHAGSDRQPARPGRRD